MIGMNVRACGPSPASAKITNAETGEDIKGIASLTVRMAPDEIVTIEATVFAGAIDITAPARFFANDPASGMLKPLSRIVFADGTEWVA